MSFFFTSFIGVSPSYRELWNVVKLLLVLGHGPAAVEWGFSVNRQVAVGRPLGVLLHLAKHGMRCSGKSWGNPKHPDHERSLDICASRKELLRCTRGSAKKGETRECRPSKRRLVEEEIDSMKKKKKLEAVIADLTASAHHYWEKAEVSTDFTFVVMSTGLRKAAKSSGRTH